MSEPSATTPYELLGGAAPVRALVKRFYDRMEALADSDPLRRMHARDLGPMREKLFEFLSGWLGGPPLYHRRTDAKCMTEAHARYAIGAVERDQWLACMDRALDDVGASEQVRAMVRPALRRVAEALRNR